MGDADFSDQLVALLPRLRHLALGLTGTVDEGDDLVQAACERALSRSQQFQPGSRLDHWMYSILRSIWIDGIRSRRRREIPVDPSSLADHPGGDLEAEAHARLCLAEVRRAIAALPEEQREALLLVAVEGIGYRRAAELLDLPMGTVTSRVFRARLAIGETVDEFEGRGARIIRMKR
jgi:RNA polymerase sigma-70 factor (ECF subfamily)